MTTPSLAEAARALELLLERAAQNGALIIEPGNGVAIIIRNAIDALRGRAWMHSSERGPPGVRRGEEAVSLVVRREPGESWRDCGLRYAKRYGLERDFRETFESRLAGGIEEGRACWEALYEWDLLDTK